MNSSGIKRGLATTAVAALAIAGLPLLAGSASAESVATSAGVTADDVMMVDPGSVVSTKGDGQNTSVRLTAIGGANVTGVTFEYSIGGASWTTIGTATGDNGTFAYEWSPGALSGALLTVRATATLAGGGTTDDAVPGVTVLNSAETTNITDGGALGVFRAPYGGDHVIVHGTGSTSSAPDLAYFADGMFQDGGTADDTTAAGASTGSWTGVVDISGTATMASPYVYGAPNQLLLRASGATEDTEAFGLYEQTITTVTAEAADDVLPTGESTDVTVTVTDQNGMPIAGARVSDSSDVDSFLTDADGQATFSQAAGSNAYYYADATAAAGYQSVLGDKKSDTVTVDQYLPAETELDATSADGAAFDMDEYAPGDVTVQVKDQNGNPVDEAGRTVTYHWEYTPFDSAVDPGETTEATATTDGTGTATIVFPTGGPSGSYTLVAELEGDGFGNGAIAASDVLTVKAGEAAFTSDPDTVQAMAGGDVDVDTVLALEDGTPLPKRDLSADYVGDDAMVLDADGDPQASVALTTDADGVATATVSDPVTDPQTEESGTLTFRDPQFDNEAVSVEFLLDLTPGVVDVDVDMPGAFGGDSAGELQRITVTVSSADENGDADDPLANTEVELSLDHGYFTDGKAGAAGTMAGEWADEGDTMTVTTDGSGEATAWVSIGRDEDFDDDGMVLGTVSATAGDVTEEGDVDWTSEDPLNAGEVMLEPTAKFNPSTLPNVVVGSTDEVFFSVVTTDQFGNRVGDESFMLSDDVPFADTTVDGDTDYDDGDYEGTAYNYSGQEVEQTVTATWDAPTTEFGAGGSRVDDSEDVTDDYTVNWYAPDLEAGTVTLSDGSDADPVVGETVTETVQVLDQNGNPVRGATVNFVRSGAGSESNDSSAEKTTGAAGKAFYTFTSDEEGDATVTATVTYDGQAVTVEDVVTFRTDDPVTKISAVIRGKNTGRLADKLAVRTRPAGAAEGATASLVKVRKNGRKVILKSKAVNASGLAIFKVKDLNGRRKTAYFIRVAKTDTTSFAKTGIRRVR